MCAELELFAERDSDDNNSPTGLPSVPSRDLFETLRDGLCVPVRPAWRPQRHPSRASIQQQLDRMPLEKRLRLFGTLRLNVGTLTPDQRWIYQQWVMSAPIRWLRRRFAI